MPLRLQMVNHGTKAYIETVKLREEILRKPLGLKFDADELMKESDSMHIACYSDNDELAGCLILQPDGELIKMRQVAVSEKYQGHGIGKAMVAFSEELAIQHEYPRIHLHARETAVEFYLKLGYQVEGEPFEEVSIPHRYMYKNIFFANRKEGQ